MILHIPHSSTFIPEQYRDLFVLSDPELQAELLLMTDAYTDELFSNQRMTEIRFPYSRLLVDVERFPEDDDEPMSLVGMGMLYTKTTDGLPLKRVIKPSERKCLRQLYDNHHQQLELSVAEELDLNGEALIVDCHSFPNEPFPYQSNQDTPRPDFCIGTDPFHTPQPLVDLAESTLMSMGYKVGINWPYAGSIVPMKYYNKDNCIKSIMIEVNRDLYMDRESGDKNGSFELIKAQIKELLDILHS